LAARAWGRVGFSIRRVAFKRRRLNKRHFQGYPRFMRRCDHCGTEFEPRKQGRRGRFCPGGECRRAHKSLAYKLGDKVATRRAVLKSRAPRAGIVECMEREAEAASCPGEFARPGSKQHSPTLSDLVQAARRVLRPGKFHDAAAVRTGEKIEAGEPAAGPSAGGF
jgi:hypothetical protein